MLVWLWCYLLWNVCGLWCSTLGKGLYRTPNMPMCTLWLLVQSSNAFDEKPREHMEQVCKPAVQGDLDC